MKTKMHLSRNGLKVLLQVLNLENVALTKDFHWDLIISKEYKAAISMQGQRLNLFSMKKEIHEHPMGSEELVS